MDIYSKSYASRGGGWLHVTGRNQQHHWHLS